MTIERKYHLFDAKKQSLGRFATEAARILSGKNKVDYTPNVDGGDFVVVIDSDNVKVTGTKMKDKMYHRYSGYPGGITSTNLEGQIEKDSTKIIKSAVYGMLPKNKLRKPMMKRLLVYKNEEHSHKIDIEHK